MSTEHTPGPWHVQTYENYTGWSVFAPGRGCIAERWYDSDQGPPYRDELLANARLIASAPALAADVARLTAERDELRAVVEAVMLVAEYKDMKSGETVGSLFPVRFNNARAILAKTAPANPNAGVVAPHGSQKGRWTP